MTAAEHERVEDVETPETPAVETKPVDTENAMQKLPNSN